MIGQTVLHYISFLTGAEEPETQTTDAERDVLCEFLPGCQRIVEVGVYEGFTTRLLAERSDPDAVVYGIDPFYSGRLGVCWGEQIAKRYNREHLLTGKLKLVRKLSATVGDLVPMHVDFVFLDGDHSLKGISDDWSFWSERLAPGGIMALHDTLPVQGKPWSAETGSREFFQSHIRHDSRFEIVRQQDSLSVLRMR